MLILTDTFETTCAFPVDELFVSFLEPRIETDRVVWEGQSAVAALNWQGGETAVDAEIILTTDHSGAPQTVHRLRLRNPVKPGTTSLEFVFSISVR